MSFEDLSPEIRLLFLFEPRTTGMGTTWWLSVKKPQFADTTIVLRAGQRTGFKPLHAFQ